MVTAVEKMEKDVEVKRRKLNVSSIDEKSQKYLKQLKGQCSRSVLRAYFVHVLSTLHSTDAALHRLFLLFIINARNQCYVFWLTIVLSVV